MSRKHSALQAACCSFSRPLRPGAARSLRPLRPRRTCRAPLRALAVLTSLMILCSSIQAQAQQVREERDREQRLQASLRAGMEYDSNALRVADDVRGDFLARYFASLDLSLQRPESPSRLSLGLRQGGKVFIDESAADTLLTQLFAGWSRNLTGPLSLQLGFDFKDRSERRSLRDYNAGGLRAGLGASLGPLQLGASGGWRYFAFKPNPDASSHGPNAQIDLRGYPGDRWMLFGNYSYAQRRFATQQVDSREDGRAILGERLRRDHYHNLGAGLSFRGFAVLDVSYRFGLNTSNSFGQRLLRHSVEATLTLPLIFAVYLSLHGELQRTLYSDPVILDANFNIDEDNRNALVASLARPLGSSWELELRYSLYTQEFGAGAARVDQDYLRQTMMLAVAYLYE